jgi:transcriptional regulator GlxA family with amidase domain
MDERVRVAIEFMTANLDRKLAPAEIAESVRLSPTHLRRLFKSQTGRSLTAYRKQLQQQRARQLLETTFLSIKEIAAAVRITSVSHFVRDFKKSYGVTPSEYAKQHRRVGGRS